jgi:hypothetical protein
MSSATKNLFNKITRKAPSISSLIPTPGIPYEEKFSLITTRPPSSPQDPSTKTKKIKLTNEKAFQKYTTSRLKRGLFWLAKDSRPLPISSIQGTFIDSSPQVPTQKGTLQYQLPLSPSQDSTPRDHSLDSRLKI